MEEPGGWLWVLMGLGVIALGIIMVWSVMVWRQRRLSGAEKREQAEVVEENYQKGG
jgi:type VI protein secretion system component VasK